MKKFYKYISAFLVCILLVASCIFVGCDKSNSSEDQPSEEENTVVGKIINFASNTNDLGECEFFWNYDKEDFVDKVGISVSSSLGEQSFDYQSQGENARQYWKFTMQQDVVYNFSFTTYFSCGEEKYEKGETITCSRMNVSNLSECNFTRIEIETEDYVWPSCEYVTHPEGCWGEGIINANYVQSKVSIFDKNNLLVYSSYADGEGYNGAKIKIRGNTSAYPDKKPFKIKLASKTDLLSSFVDERDDKNYKNKNWLLLTNGSAINQIVGSSVAESVDLSYVPEYEYVYLIVNGDFRGLYILTEGVSQGNGKGDKQSRVCVSDTGFIIEKDAYWWNEELYFETPLTENWPAKFTFKYPDSDDINESSEEYLYIKNYVSQFENALINGEDYTKYIDVDTFAKWILAQDYLAPLDAGGTNIYFYKYDSTDSSKLCMGPIWDFDSNFGCGVESVANIHKESKMFSFLFNNDFFCQNYKNLFVQTKDCVTQNIIKRTSKYLETDYDTLVDRDNLRWNKSFKHLQEQQNYAIDWMTQHIAWLENQI